MNEMTTEEMCEKLERAERAKEEAERELDKMRCHYRAAAARVERLEELVQHFVVAAPQDGAQLLIDYVTA